MATRTFTITQSGYAREFTITPGGSVRTFTVNNGIGQKGDDGATGPAGPNSVTSATTSDGTANLSVQTIGATTGVESGQYCAFGSESKAAGLFSFNQNNTRVGWSSELPAQRSYGFNVLNLAQDVFLYIPNATGTLALTASTTGVPDKLTDGTIAGTLTINSTTYTYGTGAAAAHRTALGLGTLATQSGTFSGTSSGTNTGDQTTIVGITGTTDQFNTALTDGDFATLAGSETLTNKTLASPTMSGATITGTSIVLTAGTDPSVIAVGTPTTTGAFVGGYYTLAGNSSTIYFGQNSYFNGTAFVQPNTSAASSTFLLQKQNFLFYTQSAGNASNSLGSVRARITNVGMAIGTAAPNAKAALDVQSTTQGFLPPRMTTAQRDAITSTPAGLMVYNTSTNKLNFYNGTAWEAVTSA